MQYTVGSLFAGVGGICLGFQEYSKILNLNNKKSGFQLAWANEIDRYACATYRNNFTHILFEGDIHKILHPDEALLDEREKYEIFHNQILANDIDVLTAGFPCQAFSIAGDRQGFKDKKGRGILFEEIVELIRQLQKKYSHIPRVLFLENVKNLPSHDHKKTYKIIKEELSNCGYIIKDKILNTMDYTDLPQNRERIYIVGFRDEADADAFHLFDGDSVHDINKVLKKFKHHYARTEWEKITEQLLDYQTVNSQNGSKYYYTRLKYPKYFLSEEEYSGLSDSYHHRINIAEQVNEKYQYYQIRRGMYIRHNQSNVCPTLTANMGTGGHNVPLILTNDGVRKLTPAETFKLQGFPIGDGYYLPREIDGRSYPDAQLYKQAGNAVSVPMIAFIAKYIFEALDKNDC